MPDQENQPSDQGTEDQASTRGGAAGYWVGHNKRKHPTWWAPLVIQFQALQNGLGICSGNGTTGCQRTQHGKRVCHGINGKAKSVTPPRKT